MDVSWFSTGVILFSTHSETSWSIRWLMFLFAFLSSSWISTFKPRMSPDRSASRLSNLPSIHFAMSACEVNRPSPQLWTSLGISAATVGSSLLSSLQNDWHAATPKHVHLDCMVAFRRCLCFLVPAGHAIKTGWSTAPRQNPHRKGQLTSASANYTVFHVSSTSSALSTFWVLLYRLAGNIWLSWTPGLFSVKKLTFVVPAKILQNRTRMSAYRQMPCCLISLKSSSVHTGACAISMHSATCRNSLDVLTLVSHKLRDDFIGVYWIQVSFAKRCSKSSTWW